MIDVVFVYLNESWSTFAFPAGGKIQTDGGQDDDAFVVGEDYGWIPSPTLDVADDPLEALVQPFSCEGAAGLDLPLVFPDGLQVQLL